MISLVLLVPLISLVLLAPLLSPVLLFSLIPSSVPGVPAGWWSRC
ncbi:hypothetical protein ACIBCA_07425 [Kitasatospora sp. NPDC051170]